MKKMICMFLIALMLFSVSGCGSAPAADSSAPAQKSGKSVNDVIDQQMKQSGGAGSANEPKKAASPKKNEGTKKKAEKEKAAGSDSRKADVDLSTLSSTVAYSEVYNILQNPKDFRGKTVKMQGRFAVFHATDENGDPVPEKIYCACVVSDATACCQQGLEFVLAGDSKYPDDYPEEGEEITVTGEFQTYIEGKRMYGHLIDSELGS